MALGEIDGYTGRAKIYINGKHFIPFLPRQP